jgi:hypothetical protein
MIFGKRKWEALLTKCSFGKTTLRMKGNILLIDTKIVKNKKGN